MSIFKRFRDLMVSNVNSAIDNAEDPEKMLEQFIRDMEGEYAEARAAVTQSVAAKNVIEKKYNDACEECTSWEQNAILAVEKGNDELAKKALKRQEDSEELKNTFKQQLDMQEKEVENLKSILSQLEEKLEEAKNKKEILIVKSKNAKAQKQVYETLSNVSNDGASRDFSRLEEKVNKMEAEAHAHAEMSTNSLESQFDALKNESTDSKLDDKLAQLKAKMNKE